jgi:hypothetical protein
MTAMDGGVDFDGWLRGQLSLTLGPERGPRPHPAQARYAIADRAAASRRRAFRSGARALLATGVAAALVAGGAAATAATGTANPVSWGRQVVQVVQQCQESRGTQAQGGSQGIGHCVSPTARSHGPSAPATSRGGAADTAPNARPSTPPGKRVGQQPGAQPAGDGSGNGGASSDGNGNAGSGAGGAHGHGQSQSQAPGAGHGAQSRPASSPKA